LQILRFGSDAVMLHPNPIPHLIQQPWRRWCRRRFVRHGSFQQGIRNQNVTSTFLLLYTTLAGSRHLSGCLLNVGRHQNSPGSPALAGLVCASMSAFQGLHAWLPSSSSSSAASSRSKNQPHAAHRCVLSSWPSSISSSSRSAGLCSLQPHIGQAISDPLRASAAQQFSQRGPSRLRARPVTASVGRHENQAI
jgi:hypothetical protein